MKDRFGREISYLRLSVTDLCNLRCAYCMPEEGVKKLQHQSILSIEEIEEIVRVAARLGITKIRITGGEPLVRRGITEICRRVSSIPGIAETCLTTNGSLLPRYAAELREAGIKRLNVGLDSLDADTYRTLTRGGELADALQGIEAARAAGFKTLKINAVLLGGINESELRTLAELSREQGTHVRFVELMPIGNSANWADGRYISCKAVLAAIPELIPIGSDGVAQLYSLPGAPGTVGLISSVSEAFCRACNRIRITSDGRLKPCLHSPEEVLLRGLNNDELEETMRAAIFSKPPEHTLDGVSHSRSARDMNMIGG